MNFWLKHIGWDGKETTGFYIGISRDGDVLRLIKPDGKWTDTGHNYTEEEAINAYNKIIGELKPIDIVNGK